MADNIDMKAAQKATITMSLIDLARIIHADQPGSELTEAAAQCAALRSAWVAAGKPTAGHLYVEFLLTYEEVAA